MRHYLDVDDLTTEEFLSVIALAEQSVADLGRPYEGLGVACVFEKPSARTRNSTEMAVVQLGGHPVYITDAEVGIDTRESAEDVARTLGCYHAGLCARVFDHSRLERMAATSALPVVNLLSDSSHPLQALADVLTIRTALGVDSLEGRVVTYVGDANNVTRSLAQAVGHLGGTMRVVAPPGYQFGDVDIDRLRAGGLTLELHDRPADGLPGSDVVYTDTWISMGDEGERDERLRAFEGFMVDEAMMTLAGSSAIFLHCLPAHRGEEVSAEVLDGPQSQIWLQAANRLDAIRAVLAWLTTVNAADGARAFLTSLIEIGNLHFS